MFGLKGLADYANVGGDFDVSHGVGRKCRASIVLNNLSLHVATRDNEATEKLDPGCV